MFPIRDTIPAKRFPVMNWLIIIANIAIFIYELSLNDQQLSEFIGTYGLIPAKFSLFSRQNYYRSLLFSQICFSIPGGYISF